MKYKNGLVLGKFCPIHFGHQHLISTAAKGCENLIVLACSIKKESIPGHLRAKWVKSYCDQINNIKVIDIRDELPQFPEEHYDFWNIWCDLIKKNCPDIDVIYSSEDYGFELAERLNIKHELVDKERKTVPISGTKVRENPYENWNYINSDVRSYFINRVYFLGPESTGKTTTSKLLSEKFEANWVPEYGRILYERNVGTLEFMDFCEIVIKQREIENTLSKKSDGQVIFCDTDVITTKIFCELYYPEEFHKLIEFFDFHIKRQLENKCHFFVMYPQFTEAVQDGTRKFLNYETRTKHYDMIITELDKWNMPYTVLTDDYNHRISVVENFIKPLIKEKTIID